MAFAKFRVAGILAACAISSAAEDVNFTAPTPVSNQTTQPTYYPTYWPTYSPTAVEELPEEAGAARRSVPSVRCPDSFESYVEIDNLASMQYSIVKSDDPLQSGIFCARLFVNNTDDGWVAIAFSQDGSMAGSDAVVADLEEESVLKYHLGGRDPTGVVLMKEARQTLQNTLVGVFGTFAVVEFTKLLVEENEVTINEDGINIFLHARGDVWPGYHASRTVFVDVVKKRTLSIICDETRPCPEGEYCKLEPGKCFDTPDTQVGVCTRIQDNCNWPVDYLPVCGCDQQTYGNACEVDEFGTSVAYEGFCELNERQVDPIDPTLSCLENQCLDPDGKCDAIVSCIIDPCEVQDECAFPECEANYCGGCHHVCNGNFTKVSDEINCLAEWAPVCGDDDITYPNSCEANKVNVTILYEGECNLTAIPIFQPEEKCSPGGACSAEGSSCSEGTETCCGQTYDSLKCDCVGGSWMCMHTDSCLFPSCCAAGPPKDKPAPSMDFCVPGLACDTGLEDDYCCNDFMNPGNTYCTQSGGMPEPEDSLPSVTTEPTITATTTSTVTTATTTSSMTASSMTTSATTLNSTTFETDSSTISPINSTASPTSASTAMSSSTTPPNQVQATSTEGTTTTSTASAVSSTSTTSEVTTSASTTSASTTSAPSTTTLPETTSSATNSTTTTGNTTTAPQTNSTDSTEDSTTTTVNTTTAPETTSTSSTISATLDNSITTTTANNIDWDNFQDSITQMQSTLAAEEVVSESSNTTSSTSATSSTIAPSTTTAYNFTLDFSTTAPEERSSLETTTEATTTATTTEPTQLSIGTVEGRPNSPDSSTSAAEKNVVRLFSLSCACLMLAAHGI